MWKIVVRVLAGLLLAVYVAVALANYSVVQSYLGTWAGRRLSEQWGGEVKIGSLHAMPWDHLIVNNLRLVSPTGDTLLDLERMSITFKRFPYRDHGLELDRVVLRNGYYHLLVEEDSLHPRPVTNLQYIIDHYTHGEPLPPLQGTFSVSVNVLMLHNIRYKMDLLEQGPPYSGHGVEVAHMEFGSIRGRIKDIRVVNDDVACRVVRLAARERSGFVADDIKGNVHVGPNDITVTGFEARTPRSTILADVRISYDGWKSMLGYLDNVDHQVEIHDGTSLALGDIGYWVPQLWGGEAQLAADGSVSGSVNRLRADLHLAWGEQSALTLNGRLDNIARPDSAHVDLDIERLRTNHRDLQPLLDLLHAAPAARQLAREVDHLDLGLRLRGGLHRPTTANLRLVSGLGHLRADASLRPLDRDGMTFDLEAGSDGIALRPLHSDWLSRTAFSISTHGAWARTDDPSTLRAELQGELLNSVVRGQRIAPLYLGGALDHDGGRLNVQSTDSLAQFDLAALFSLFDSVKSVRCTLDVGRLDLAAFRLLPAQLAPLSTRATLRLDGQGPDQVQGHLDMEDTRLGNLGVDRLALDAEAADALKSLTLGSTPLDASIRGRFGYGDLPLMVRHFCHAVLPADLAGPDTLTADEQAAIADNTLNYHLHWKDGGQLMQQLLPAVAIAQDSRIDGSYNTAELLKMVVRSDSLRLGSVLLDNLGLSSRFAEGKYTVEAEAQNVSLGDMELLQRAVVTLGSNPGQAQAGLSWGTDGSATRGDLMLGLRQGRVRVLEPHFSVGGTQWQLLVDSLAVGTTGGLQAVGHGIALRSEGQSATASLSLRRQDNDYVELLFDNFALEGLADIALHDSPLSVSGALGGRFSLYGLANIPYFNANLRIDSCMVNRLPLGEVGLRSHWNAELNMLNLELAGSQLAANGWVELGGEENEVNLNVDFNALDLGLAAPLIRDFSNRLEGRLHGNFDITGPLNRPLIEGEAYVEQGALGISLTGVTYFLDDSIRFANRIITLDGFTIRDPRGNTASVDGSVRYNSLDDISLDLRLHTDNLLLLDRRQGEDFRGTLLASASGTVEGPIDNLRLEVRARTNAGSSLTVPVSDQQQVKAHNYITFVGDQPARASRQRASKREQQLALDLDLDLTPDLALNLPMDFSDVTVKVAANGSGDLHLSLAGEEEPKVRGSYEITSGTMKLGLLSLIEKTFSIETGSNLGFQGGLSEARFDLRAVYSQRVNLSTLTGSLSEVGGGQKYLQVEDVIAIAGTLNEPTIGFDIRLPNADASVEEEVFAYIDRNSERDMLNQTLSLLVLGQFYNANSAALNGNIATSGSIGTLSGLLSDMVGVVDINVDYKAANELTKEQFDVNISKDWGRWYLESTLGYGGESRELETADGGSAVIDALVGYRLSPLVHLFVYNRTNTNDYTRMDLPYKQGVGLKLTKDFDRWSDLFKSKKKRLP